MESLRKGVWQPHLSMSKALVMEHRAEGVTGHICATHKSEASDGEPWFTRGRACLLTPAGLALLLAIGGSLLVAAARASAGAAPRCMRLWAYP